MAEDIGVIRVGTRTDGTQVFSFHCHGCKYTHAFLVGGPSGSQPRWTWNGSYEKPTFSPSLLYRGQDQCHLFLTDGKIRYLSDCHHELAGKTVDIVSGQVVAEAPQASVQQVMQESKMPISMRQAITPHVYTHKPFPTVRYHRELGEKIVNNPDELEALGDEWRDSPFPANLPAPEPPKCAGPVVTSNRGKTWACLACGAVLGKEVSQEVQDAHKDAPCKDLTAEDYVDPSEAGAEKKAPRGKKG